MNREIKVNEATARLFYDQCMGSHNGHMASIPNNPVIASICEAHFVGNKQDFAEFLRKVADELENEKF